MEALETRELGQVCFQVQLDRAPSLDASAFEQRAEAIARATQGVRGFEVTRSEDSGAFMNLVFAAEQPIEAWSRLRVPLFESEFGAILLASSMCVCTGKDGWNDYLLLFHFDPSVATDAGA